MAEEDRPPWADAGRAATGTAALSDDQLRVLRLECGHALAIGETVSDVIFCPECGTLRQLVRLVHPIRPCAACRGISSGDAWIRQVGLCYRHARQAFECMQEEGIVPPDLAFCLVLDAQQSGQAPDPATPTADAATGLPGPPEAAPGGPVTLTLDVSEWVRMKANLRCEGDWACGPCQDSAEEEVLATLRGYPGQVEVRGG